MAFEGRKATHEPTCDASACVYECQVAAGRKATPTEVIIDGREYVTKDWHGLRLILRDVYPADIFTGESGDLGPRLIALLREIDEAQR